MIESAVAALGTLFAPWPLLFLLLGLAIGIVAGLMPGTATGGFIVVLGFAYLMEPVNAIPFAVGALVPISTMDAVPAVLMGIPGSASAQALIMDGYPMAKKGEAERALSASYGASLVGSIIGGIAFVLLLPVARVVLRYLGSPEFLAVGLLGIGMLAALSRGAVLKGFLAGLFGVVVGMIGLDPAVGAPRLWFGSRYLLEGIPIVPFVIGLFALPEFVLLLMRGRPIAHTALPGGATERTQRHQGLVDVWHNKFLMFRSSILGLIVGMMPGVGGSVVDWLVYSHAKATERGASETFGKGDVRGVIAPGASDNALVAGAFIPTLVLGIPGSVSMALFLGFMLIIGLQPGPRLLEGDGPELLLLIIFALVLANVIATSIGLALSRTMAKIANIPPAVLVPIMVCLMSVLAFQGSSNIGDLVVMLVFGMVGTAMRLYGWARPPFLIGFILIPVIEQYGRITANTIGWDALLRPQIWVIMAIAVAFIFLARKAQSTSSAEKPADPTPDKEPEYSDAER